MSTPKKKQYVRTAGSRTATLYSKRTAQKLNRIYEKEQSKRVKKISADRINTNGQQEVYNDYYDDPRSYNKKSGSRTVPILVSALIVAVLALVFVGLSMMNPKTHQSIDLVQDPVPSVENNINTQTTSTAEVSDPPVIYGVIPIVVYQGHSVAYKSAVYVVDDTDPSPKLEIDNEAVDLSTPGSYVVSYIASDKDGNVTTEFTTVTVLEGTEIVDEAEVYALADKILDSIITDDMTDEYKCLKVYEYLHAIGYVDEVHSEDWMQNAYWMLTLREGDCFGYYCASRLLLNRLGYDVMEVCNNNNYVHYWCLVSIDEGETWWHFDATCWSWGEDGILCLVSDEYMNEFAQRHRTSDRRLIHAWDRTAYPATPEEDFWTDEERSVIYEGGLIDVDATYDPNLWGNSTWEDIDPYYSYEYVEEYTTENAGEYSDLTEAYSEYDELNEEQDTTVYSEETSAQEIPWEGEWSETGYEDPSGEITEEYEYSESVEW